MKLCAWLILAGTILTATAGNATSLTERAAKHLPALKGAVSEHWPDAPLRHTMAGQVEQESTWKERATLKTSRELGRGLVQLTIAYHKDGTERFNAYRDAARIRALRGWDWETDPYNVRYQLTYLVLTDKANYRQMQGLRFVDATETFKAALVCYNAGPGRVLNRRALALAKGIPHDRWTGGLDRAYSSKEAVMLYGRPLYEAVNHYPQVVFKKAEKYRGRV